MLQLRANWPKSEMVFLGDMSKINWVNVIPEISSKMMWKKLSMIEDKPKEWDKKFMTKKIKKKQCKNIRILVKCLDMSINSINSEKMLKLWEC